MKVRTLARLFVLLIIVNPAQAMVMGMPRHYAPNQSAFIQYENGVQTTFVQLAAQAPKYGEPKRVWIFPIPTSPENIEVDTLEDFPVLNGTSVQREFRDHVNQLGAYMAIAAFPPGVLFFAIFSSVGSIRTTTAYSGMESDSKAVVLNGLTIYQHLDKHGFATEVIKAENVDKFKTYLAARGTNLDPDAEEFLSEYMGKNYSFVVSWIAPPLPVGPDGKPIYPDEPGLPIPFDQDRPTIEPDYYPYPGDTKPVGVLIRFATPEIYYPLKPMAYYGQSQVPVSIVFSGWREIRVFDNIQNQSVVSHEHLKFLNRTIDEEKTLARIFGDRIPSEFAYTRLTIQSQADYFTQDLRIDPNAMANGAQATHALNQSWWVWIGPLMIGFSLLAAAIGNQLWLKGSLKPLDLGIIAIANLFTLIGAGIAIGLLKKEKFGAHADESGLVKKLVFLAIMEFLVFVLGIAVFIVASALFQSPTPYYPMPYYR